MTTMRRNPSIQDELISGLRLASLVVLTCAAAILLIWGTLIVSRHAQGSIVLGWVALALGFLIVLSNPKRLARLLPGLLALAALNAFVMGLTGTLLSSSSRQVSRPMAWGTGIALAVGAFASTYFYNRKLRAVDRLVLGAYVACILAGVASQHVLLWFTAGTLALSAPWLVDRIRETMHKA